MDEDIKPYLLYLLLVGPTLIAACHNERTRFDPDPAAHMSMITKALCLAWSRVNRYLDLLIGDPTYSQLLLNNILSGVPSTGTALHSSTPVAALRAIVAQQNLPNDVSNGLHLAIDNVYRIRLSMIRAEQDNAAGHPLNNINRFLPAWLSVNSSLPEAFWDYVSVANPHETFRIILCHWAALCHRAGNVWWCNGMATLLFDNFRERLLRDPALRTHEHFNAMRIVSRLLNRTDRWENFKQNEAENA